jgi:hypothetical protein
MELIEQTFNGSVGARRRVNATISRNGDLVHDCFLDFSVSGCCVSSDSVTMCSPQQDFFHQNLGTALINSVEVEIGGQEIDKHYGHWMETWTQLTLPNSVSYDANYDLATGVGMTNNFQRMALSGGVNVGEIAYSDHIRVPLQFWFCKNPGLALPLIALQYHEVEIKVELGGNSEVISKLDASLWCNYIYLDTDERRRFAQVSHEYLIEQVQYQCESASNKYRLNFNHPVKEIIWIGTPDPDCKCGNHPSTPNPIVTEEEGNCTEFKLQLNGQDRFAAQSITYFSQWQVNQYHTGEGSRAEVAGEVLIPTIAVYSFALKPEEHQPSGTCNFSRIDTAELHPGCKKTNHLNIYAVNYNVLRIMSGMGGLAYSN